MDFGNILNEWENKKSGRIYDKDAEEDAETISAQENRRRLRNKRPDAEIDIHGLNREEAWQALETFFSESKNAGHEKIIIIHGKGNHSTGDAVLKRMVLEFIEHCPNAGESGRGKAVTGGEGATWVLLKEAVPLKDAL
jgi:DNA-nicking Smr family endonuclease